ncbi:MAG TPA: histidine kinase [Candidatus Limnocylindrales bacterium]|nr:histidine kinase [Candidatus Limnocylindrales bacterium]
MSVPTDTDPRSKRRLAPVVIDATIAFGLAAASLVSLFGGADDVGDQRPLSVFLLLMESLPLLFRRRYPIAILAITFGATLAHAGLAPEGASVQEGFGSLVALYTVAERRDRRTSVALALVVALGFASLIIDRGGMPRGLQGLIQTELVVGLAWALGDLSRTRRLFAAVLEDRTRLLEAEREDRARRAIVEERERIARELHDVVTHHVSVIVIQAGAGLRALDRRPEQARTALQAVDRTGREALADMRRMLGILGGPHGDDGGIRDAVDRSPQPGLDRLGELVEQVRAAGSPVELSIEGERRPLDAGVELSAYRIVQEALTNVLKHAHGARARVDLRYGARALDITVTDEGGTGRRDLGEPAHEGRGLIGMTERATLYGGTLEAGPTPTGFRVAARLPTDIAAGT